MILIDTNILARYLLDDIPDQSARSQRLFQQASRGEIAIFVPTTAVSELTWLLIKQKGYPKEVVIGLLLDVFRISSVVVENYRAVTDALRFLKRVNGLSFVDCYHLALTKDLGMTQIYSFDKKMDRYPGIERIEPE